MKVLLSILFLALSSAACAADSAGDPCPKTGHLIAQVGGEVLSCVDGAWQLTSHVGTKQITLAVQVMEGDKPVASFTVTTLDGQPAPISIGDDYSPMVEATVADQAVTSPDPAGEGLFMTMTPTLAEDGDIMVDLFASRSKPLPIQAVARREMETLPPQVATVEIKENLTMKSGKAITIPFGGFSEHPQSVEIGLQPPSRYTLTLVATKS